MSFQRKIFLAANSPSGFVSFFDELYNPYRNCRAYIIKGGPGTGKSSFMKKIAAAAEEKGHEVTRVFCSSDPQSLDGVMIPSLSVCVADGTAPHVLEPRFPGAVENIVNLGEFWNEKELFEKSDEIRSLSLENSIFHRRSSRFLSAAGALFQENERLLAPYVLEDKLSGFAARFCARETPKKKHAAPGKKSVCLLSGITPQGIVFFDETVKACASRVIGVEDGHIFQTVDSRYPTNTSGRKIADTISALAGGLAEIELKRDTAPFYMSIDNSAVKVCMDVYNAVTGEDAKPYTMGGGTYARDFPNGVSFGPEHPERSYPDFFGPIHGADEAASIDEFMEALKIYILALIELEAVEF